MLPTYSDNDSYISEDYGKNNKDELYIDDDSDNCKEKKKTSVWKIHIPIPMSVQQMKLFSSLPIKLLENFLRMNSDYIN